MENSGFPVLTFYPNPASDELLVEGDVSELEKIEIYDAVGRDMTLLIKFKEDTGTRLSLDVSALSQGMYYIKTKTTATKVIKE